MRVNEKLIDTIKIIISIIIIIAVASFGAYVTYLKYKARISIIELNETMKEKEGLCK